MKRNACIHSKDHTVRLLSGPPAMETLEPRLLLSASPLTGLSIENPLMDFNSGGAIEYDSGAQTLEGHATPFLFQLSATDFPVFIQQPASLDLGIRIDNTGQLLGGVAGDDLRVEGQIDLNNDGNFEYAGDLLTGEVLSYGIEDVGSTDPHEFVFLPTGGALVDAGLFDGKNIGVRSNSLNSTYFGSFASDWAGSFEGKLGTIDRPLGGIDVEKYIAVEDDASGELEGKTPGYWRQSHHFDDWTNYASSDSFEDVFGVDAYGDKTLHEAVQLGGGGEKALMRHAVAALLNAANPYVNYAYSEQEVIDAVQGAFASGQFESTKNDFEQYNELEADLTDLAPVASDPAEGDYGLDADTPAGPTVRVGDSVTFTYVVTNTGEAALDGVSLTDDNATAGDASDDFAPEAVLGDNGFNVGDADADGLLDVGEEWLYTQTVDVLAEGQQVNVAVATATPVYADGRPAGATVTDSDPAHYNAEAQPGSGQDDEPDDGDDPVVCDTQGLTPGFWKQKRHLQYWEGYDRCDGYEQIFGVDAPCDVNLRQALKARGGGVNALLRHSVAALLNAAHGEINYAYSVDEVIDLTRQAFATGQYEAVKNQFAAANEAGCVDLKGGGCKAVQQNDSRDDRWWKKAEDSKNRQDSDDRDDRGDRKDEHSNRGGWAAKFKRSWKNNHRGRWARRGRGC